MKKSLIIILSILFPITLAAQDMRSITIEGKAERELIPDEIYLHLAIREYKKLDGSKMNLDDLEKDLLKQLKKNGISEEQLNIQNLYGYNWNWKKERSKELMARKEYRIKLSDLNQVNQLLEAIDSKAIEQVRIGETSHSNEEVIKNELMAEAVINAKAKAKIMLDPLGEEVGKVLEINEQGSHANYPIMYKSMAMADGAEMGPQQVNLEFRKIKYEVRVMVKFQIGD